MKKMTNQVVIQLIFPTILCGFILLSQMAYAVTNKRMHGDVKIINLVDAELIITAEPKMPAFKAVATVEYSSEFYEDFRDNISPFSWKLVIRHVPIPGRLELFTLLDNLDTEKDFYEPNFNLLRSIKRNNYNQYEFDGFVDEGILAEKSGRRIR